jgi:hypothetical protein
MNRILLIDLSQREREARDKLAYERDQLKALLATKDRSGGLSRSQEQRLAAIEELLDADRPVDRLYQGVAAHVARRPWPELSDNANDRKWILEHGLFASQSKAEPEAALSPEEQEIVAVCGLMQLDNVDPENGHFTRRLSEAQGLYRESQALFDAAFGQFSARFKVALANQIDQGLVDSGIVGCIAPGRDIANDKGVLRAAGKDLIPARNDKVYALSGRNLASVVRRLNNDHVSAADPWLSSRMENAYNQLTGLVNGGSPSAMDIVLPDLDEAVDVEIQKENLHAVQAIYFVYMLEEMRIFQVVERIVELFRQGLLPLGRGIAGDFLFSYYRKTSERITETERRDLYLRLFGAPGGTPGAEPNREFNELWLRFISAVSSFARQNTVEHLLRSTIPSAVSQEQVRKAARDLGANLSRNGYGIAYFAATELQQTILEFRDVLQDPELRAALGAKDMFQVIDTINVNYLGGARNTHRYRTQSKAGAVIIRWIANNAARLSNISGDVISLEQLNNARVRAAVNGHNPTVEPSDWDLINACEQWLSVGGVQDQSVEQYSQPIESPVMTSRLMQMPQAARDTLQSVGIELPGI